MSIYVGNLPFAASQEDVSSVFTDYGTVQSVQIPIARETGNVHRFAFVEMETDVEEMVAIKALNGVEWMSRALKANQARPNTERGSSGGRAINNNRNFSGNYRN